MRGQKARGLPGQSITKRSEGGRPALKGGNCLSAHGTDEQYFVMRGGASAQRSGATLGKGEFSINSNDAHSTMILQRALSRFFSMVADNVPLFTGVFGAQARIVRQFYAARALSPHTARRFYPRSSAEAAAFASLLKQFIICQSTPGHYFLNLDALRWRSAGFPTWRE